MSPALDKGKPSLSFPSHWVTFPSESSSHPPVDRTLCLWPDATEPRIAGWNLRNCESKSFLPVRCWSQICCHSNEKRNCRLYGACSWPSPRPRGGPWSSLLNQGTTLGSGDRKAPPNSPKAQLDQKETEMPWLKLAWGPQCWEAVEMKTDSMPHHTGIHQSQELLHKCMWEYVRHTQCRTAPPVFGLDWGRNKDSNFFHMKETGRICFLRKGV